MAADGHFLTDATAAHRAPIPEERDDEARELARAARAFLDREVAPRVEALERGDRALLRGLLAEAGRRGLLGVELPERYGGLGLSPLRAAGVFEALGREASFAVSAAAHVTIGTLPLLRFGADALRDELLPACARGERIGAYALTEPGAGSDAFALSTRARPTDGGASYRLTGQKQFVTNAAICDHLVVFARDDDGAISAFLVERAARGVTVGPEEDKLGIRGSSTCPVYLDDVEVAASRLLGEAGGGHRVALGVVADGRRKLAVLAAGHAKLLCARALRYARERRQFGRPIGQLGLVRGSLAMMLARTYALEALACRALGPTAGAAEASIAKLFGSEAVGAIADATLQVHGGYGFLAGPVERSHRDARINRIFEGTNEINRLAVATALARSVRREGLDLEGAAAPAWAELADAFEPTLPAGANPPEVGAAFARAARRLALVGARLALDGVLPLDERQDQAAALADLAVELYALEAAVARAARAPGRDGFAPAAAALAAADGYERAFAAYARVAAARSGAAPPRARLSPLELAPALDRRGLEEAIAAPALELGDYPPEPALG